MMGYWDHWCFIWLKKNSVHGITKPWLEKAFLTVSESQDLGVLEYCKTEERFSIGEFEN